MRQQYQEVVASAGAAREARERHDRRREASNDDTADNE
jgi:hypothetical protein